MENKREHHNWAEIDVLYNTMTVPDISEATGINKRVLYNHRRSIRLRGKKKWDDYKHLLGVIPDKEIAGMLNITSCAVIRMRNRLGIEPIRTNKEMEVQSRLVKELGECNQFVPLGFGIADVITNDGIYEVKTVIDHSHVKQAISQLLMYSYSLLGKRLYIVGGSKRISDKLEEYLLGLGIYTKVV
jgi:hypothetical protein